MGGSDFHLYGGFTLSPYLAMKVFEVVGEIASQNVDPTLSHVDDDNCDVCRKAAAGAEPPPSPDPSIGRTMDLAA